MAKRTEGELNLAEWLNAHADVAEAGTVKGDLCDFDHEDVLKIREAAKLLAEREVLRAVLKGFLAGED